MKNQNFGKPLCRLITMVAICMLSLNAMAWDFSYTHQGKTLYYNITSSNTVAVTYYDYYGSNYVSGAVVIPSSVTNSGTTYSVTEIGNSAFDGCSSLTSVTIPNSVTSIGEDAFRGCSSLTSLTIPNSVNSIGNEAFEYCSSLTSLTIPNSVNSIGEIAFRFCSSLTSLNFNAVNCGDFLYGTPFDSCPISTINIGDSVQRIPVNFASGLGSLTSVTIPNSVTSIGHYAFWYCSSLTSVTIGSSVTSIGNGAFGYCDNLTSIVSNAVVPPAIGGSEAFPYPNICSVTVPCGSLGAYTAPVCYWSVFFPNRITEEGDVFDVSVAANDDSFGSVSVESQSCSVKVITATPSSCKSFTAWNDGNTDNPRTITVTSDTSFTAIFESVELSHNITAAICEGTAYAENGFNVSEAGVYTQNLQTINGCDSTVTLTLTVNPVATTTLQAAICEGTAYTENGFNVSEAGVYTQNLQTINGCDSTVTLTLTVNPVATTNLTAAICEGTVYTENGFNVSEAGVYTQNLQTINGCDSTVTLTLTVNPVATTNLTAAICEGTAYTENGFNVSEAGVYTQNLQTINGCDSTVTLNLTVNPVATTTLQAAICEGTVYTENGFNVSEAGVYTQNLQTINGCDSTVTLTLTVNPVYNITIDATINQGDVYQENGFEVSEAGVYTQSLQSVNGCDSVIVLNLTVNSSLGDVAANTIEVALYPNPAEDYTVLKVQGLKEQTKVTLFDLRGRKLREFDLAVGTETLRLDLRDLPSGVYTLMIGNTTKKLIVE